jgi:hypothetical protein
MDVEVDIGGLDHAIASELGVDRASEHSAASGDIDPRACWQHRFSLFAGCVLLGQLTWTAAINDG